MWRGARRGTREQRSIPASHANKQIVLVIVQGIEGHGTEGVTPAMIAAPKRSLFVDASGLNWGVF